MELKKQSTRNSQVVWVAIIAGELCEKSDKELESICESQPYTQLSNALKILSSCDSKGVFNPLELFPEYSDRLMLDEKARVRSVTYGSVSGGSDLDGYGPVINPEAKLTFQEYLDLGKPEVIEIEYITLFRSSKNQIDLRHYWRKK